MIEAFLLSLKNMMKRFHLILSLSILSLFFGCNSENRENSRAYVEGKITGNQVALSKILINLKSDGKNVAETIPNSTGNFVLSGPLLSESFSLNFNEKIKSFSASKTGCILSNDSLQIQIPSGTTYITFTEIMLK